MKSVIKIAALVLSLQAFSVYASAAKPETLLDHQRHYLASVFASSVLLIAGGEVRDIAPEAAHHLVQEKAGAHLAQLIAEDKAHIEPWSVASDAMDTAFAKLLKATLGAAEVEGEEHLSALNSAGFLETWGTLEDDTLAGPVFDQIVAKIRAEGLTQPWHIGQRSYELACDSIRQFLANNEERFWATSYGIAMEFLKKELHSLPGGKFRHVKWPEELRGNPYLEPYIRVLDAAKEAAARHIRRASPSPSEPSAGHVHQTPA